ncbi:MAG: hypothetical protein GC164_00590 [Phycisphaera sp.]|nr:hypothetical protein [Phycisphaera sp.]
MKRMTYYVRAIKTGLGLLIVFTAVCVRVCQATPPGLEPQQLEQLKSGAVDHARSLDDAGLYPLLQNAAWWQAGDITGATIPDYNELLEHPADHRGELFLIEGELAGVPDKVGRLSRPGPWDQTLQQWGIRVQANPDMVAVVLLLDPPSDQARPKVGTRVRLPARFYKVWIGVNQFDQPKPYTLFVGRSLASVQAGYTGPTPPKVSPSQSVGVVLALVAIMGGAFWMIRRSLKVKPLRSSDHFRHRRDDDDGADTDDGPPLPEDPVEAMKELERRRKESGEQSI